MLTVIEETTFNAITGAELFPAVRPAAVFIAICHVLPPPLALFQFFQKKNKNKPEPLLDC